MESQELEVLSSSLHHAFCQRVASLVQQEGLSPCSNQDIHVSHKNVEKKKHVYRKYLPFLVCCSL